MRYQIRVTGKLKKTNYEFLEFNKIEIASCFVISKVHFNYEVLVKKWNKE